MKQEYIQKMTQILSVVKPRMVFDFKPQDSFRDVMGLDSLDLVEFVARLEQQFAIHIPDEDLPGLSSLDATARYILKKHEPGP